MSLLLHALTHNSSSCTLHLYISSLISIPVLFVLLKPSVMLTPSYEKISCQFPKSIPKTFSKTKHWRRIWVPGCLDSFLSRKAWSVLDKHTLLYIMKQNKSGLGNGFRREQLLKIKVMINSPFMLYLPLFVASGRNSRASKQTRHCHCPMTTQHLP